MRSEFSLGDYLRRIRVDQADLRGLDAAASIERVATAQLASVPFENLDILRGRPVSIDPAAIVATLVGAQRGGICYQLNGLLLFALRALGLDADVVAARVLVEATPGPPLGHMAVLVHTDGGDRLVDVGFGGNHVHRGIDLGIESERAVSFPGGAQYLLEPGRRELVDFVAMAWWHSTSPASRFTGSLVCSRTSAGVRETLTDTADGAGFRLIRTEGDRRGETALDGSEARKVLEQRFGVLLDADPVPRAHANRQSVGKGSPR